MKIAKIVLAGVAVVIITTTAGLAEQALTGTVAMLDRINGTIAIKQTQSGTVGANGAATEQFKAQDGLPLEALHAGDRVTFSATEKDGIKTITKIQKQ